MSHENLNGTEGTNGSNGANGSNGTDEKVEAGRKERSNIEEKPTELERVDGRALLDEIEQVLRSYVVLPQWAAETLALWCVHTYAFELRDVGTYIGLSRRRSGAERQRCWEF